MKKLWEYRTVEMVICITSSYAAEEVFPYRGHWSCRIQRSPISLVGWINHVVIVCCANVKNAFEIRQTFEINSTHSPITTCSQFVKTDLTFELA